AGPESGGRWRVPDRCHWGYLRRTVRRHHLGIGLRPVVRRAPGANGDLGCHRATQRAGDRGTWRRGAARRDDEAPPANRLRRNLRRYCPHDMASEVAVCGTNGGRPKVTRSAASVLLWPLEGVRRLTHGKTTHHGEDRRPCPSSAAPPFRDRLLLCRVW